MRSEAYYSRTVYIVSNGEMIAKSQPELLPPTRRTLVIGMRATKHTSGRHSRWCGVQHFISARATARVIAGSGGHGPPLNLFMSSASSCILDGQLSQHRLMHDIECHSRHLRDCSRCPCCYREVFGLRCGDESQRGGISEIHQQSAQGRIQGCEAPDIFSHLAQHGWKMSALPATVARSKDVQTNFSSAPWRWKWQSGCAFLTLCSNQSS